MNVGNQPHSSTAPALIGALPAVNIAGAADSASTGPRTPFAARWQHVAAHSFDISDPYRLTVIFVLSGAEACVSYGHEDCAQSVNPGDASLIPPEKHAAVNSRGSAEYLSVCFPITLATGAASISPLCVSTDNTLERIGKIIQAALADQSRPEQWEVSSWATVLGKHLARHYGHRIAPPIEPYGSRDLVAATIGFIDRNLQRNLPIAILAEHAGTSESQFSARFKRATGASPHRFIVARRINRAAALLSAGEDSLADIAHAVGFSSQSHMTRLFHDRLGMTPSQYRKQARGRTSG
jgi:AraC family transcriptional regulator